MTKRHYKAIAAIFRKYVAGGGTAEVDALLLDMTNYMERENPLFDRAIFLDAAGFNT